MQILQAEGITSLDAKGLYEWWRDGGGHARRHLYNDSHLNRACQLMEYMHKLAFNEEGGDNIFTLSEIPEDQRSEDHVSVSVHLTWHNDRGESHFDRCAAVCL
jgi:hypothetical protein